MLRAVPLGPVEPPRGPGEDFIPRLSEALRAGGVGLEGGEVLAVASKVVAYRQGRVRPVSHWEGAAGEPEARRLAERYGAPGWKAAAVLEEADRVLGGHRGYLLAYRGGVAVGTAGIDRSNAPPGSVVLGPVDPDLEARRVVEWARREMGVEVGALVVDSRLTLFRRGVLGVALGGWGIRPLRDLRGSPDIFGRPLRFTVGDVADALAAAAALVMGEAAERTPFAVVSWDGIEVGFDGGLEEVRVPPEECYVYRSLSDPWEGAGEGGRRYKSGPADPRGR